MKFFKSSNPVLNKVQDASDNVALGGQGYDLSQGVATASGAVGKAFFLVLITLISMVAFMFYAGVNPTIIMPATLVSAIVGFGLVIFMMFKPDMAGAIAPAYAVVEGVFLGSVNFVFAIKFGMGLILQAGAVTGIIFLVMLALYKFQIVKVTAKFRSIMSSIAIGLLIYFGIVMLLGLFGVDVPMVTGSGPMALGFTGLLALVAAFFLLMDLDNIEQLKYQQVPKYFEWYCAFGLLVTLVWLYVEVLRFLSILRGSD